MQKHPIDAIAELKAEASINRTYFIDLTRTHNVPEVDTLLLDLISLKEKEYDKIEKLIELLK